MLAQIHSFVKYYNGGLVNKTLIKSSFFFTAESFNEKLKANIPEMFPGKTANQHVGFGWAYYTSSDLSCSPKTEPVYKVQEQSFERTRNDWNKEALQQRFEAESCL